MMPPPSGVGFKHKPSGRRCQIRVEEEISDKFYQYQFQSQRRNARPLLNELEKSNIQTPLLLPAQDLSRSKPKQTPMQLFAIALMAHMEHRGRIPGHQETPRERRLRAATALEHDLAQRRVTHGRRVPLVSIKSALFLL